MFAIAGEIVVVLLVAAAGGTAGWLLGRRGRNRAVATARDEATTGTRILHGAGIFTFRQIANWRPEDLDAITARLGDSPAPLKRDAWIDGARREYLRKYGEAP